jgi:CubicO group peptidase (beta-lactamase class C family)
MRSVGWSKARKASSAGPVVTCRGYTEPQEFPLPHCAAIVLCLVGGWLMGSVETLAQPSQTLPMTGQATPSLSDFDTRMIALMETWHLPGGQLAVAKDGRLVLSRGYGYGDVERKQPVQTDSLFRIGSVSKTLTTVAILKLLESGQIHLNDSAFRILSDLRPPKGAVVDSRLYEITIQQLLQHEGGWESNDLLELPWSRMASAIIGRVDPPECETIIRYAMSVPLDFTPGTKANYSNFGFCVVGRVIEAVATRVHNRKTSYEEYVKKEVLVPAGVNRARLGGTRLSDRAIGEVRYYGQANQPLSPSVYPGEGYVPFAYGGFYLRAGGAAGGWIASAEDLVRFGTAIDGQRGQALLKPETFRIMTETPVPSSTVAGGTGRSIGLCWTVARRTDGIDFWHTGALKDSNAAWLVRTSEGVTLAFTFNSVGPDVMSFLREVIPAMHDLVKEPRTWPKTDLWAAR